MGRLRKAWEGLERLRKTRLPEKTIGIFFLWNIMVGNIFRCNNLYQRAA